MGIRGHDGETGLECPQGNTFHTLLPTVLPRLRRDDGGNASMSTKPKGRAKAAEHSPGGESHVEVLRELVAHLRQGRSPLREEWARRIMGARFLTAMTNDEILAEVSSVYDNYLGALETGSIEALEAYARDLSERIIPRGVETHEVVGIVLLLRDVLARSLFSKYGADCWVFAVKFIFSDLCRCFGALGSSSRRCQPGSNRNARNDYRRWR